MRYSCLPTAFAFALGVGLVSAGFANAAPAPSAPAPVLKHHAFGLDVKAAKAAQSHDTSSGNPLPVLVGRTGAPPDSYSLEQYAQSPGNQGQVGSCVTWATGYSAYGVLMNEQNISGGPMAPMYIYSQIAQGNDTGTYASVAIPMEEQQGIDTKSDYYQGDFDYTTQPTDAERANAAHYKTSGSQDLINSSDRQQAIEQAISTGMPVPIGFEVRQSFENLNSSNYNYNPDPSESVLGGHEVTIVAYDQTGVTIENSWGTGWGNSGFFTAPWSWINSSDVDEIHSMGRLVTE
ncbi:C1 family peptidase [Nocardia terpenica]|uniref:Peptidase n=1 Tax=Nocardia terpenica TaxID=455432 RepID=A0A6G9Z3F5_9NOCA|nr:C1 family peptidase [Nocardia terpenica]QIS20135.1 peptidase [Nocardia terpenica]